MIRIFYESIRDNLVRECFKKVSDYLNARDVLKPDFKFMEIDLVSGTNTIPHPFGKIPRDAFFTSVIPDNTTIRFRYEDFTMSNLSIQANAICTVRCFVGNFIGGNNV